MLTQMTIMLAIMDICSATDAEGRPIPFPQGFVLRHSPSLKSDVLAVLRTAGEGVTVAPDNGLVSMSITAKEDSGLPAGSWLVARQ